MHIKTAQAELRNENPNQMDTNKTQNVKMEKVK